MKKSSLILALAALLLGSAMVSCSMGQSVEPAKTSISGPLGAYFKVVDRPYKIRNGVVNLEFKRVRPGFGSDNPTFSVELMDKEFDVIAKAQTSILFDNEMKSLASLGIGESGTISFSFDGSLFGAAYFRVSSTCDDEDYQSGYYGNSGRCPDFICVTGDNVRFRSGPGVEYDPVKDIFGENIHPDKGEILKCIGQSDDFYKVLYGGEEMFISKLYTEPSSATSATYPPDEPEGFGDTMDYEEEFDDEDEDEIPSSTANVESVLKDYNALADKYVDLLKKMDSGSYSYDLESKWSDILSETISLQAKLASFASDMSTIQAVKMSKATEKMSSAFEKYKESLKSKYPSLF